MMLLLSGGVPIWEDGQLPKSIRLSVGYASFSIKIICSMAVATPLAHANIKTLSLA
jgi:hypothetical protein